VDRLINAASGTFVVFLEMRNAQLRIPAGVKCKAQLASEGASTKVPARGP
jgi:hypothetical protein